jgi:hypothetical protein
MIKWSEFVLPDVDVFVVIDVGTWFYDASMHLVFHVVEVL